MNVDPYANEPINRAIWQQREMRVALARRDITSVYRLLQQAGVNQRMIARLTAQSPSEVYEILKGRRVSAYEVLVRITDGLGVPRGYLGLAYDESTQNALEPEVSPLILGGTALEKATDEPVQVRGFLRHAADVATEKDIEMMDSWWQPVERNTTHAPRRIGLTDVEHVKALTSAMRAIDWQYGGGACRDAISAQVRWSQQLLDADASEEVRRDLLIALADMHSLAGWSSFDVGMHEVARRHFSRAMEQAKYAKQYPLLAFVLYQAGRLHLHRHMPQEALRFFQLGQIVAQDSNSAVTTALLHANQAWAYAHLSDRKRMTNSLNRAEAELELARNEGEQPDEWVQFFDELDFLAMRGVAVSDFPGATSAELEQAISDIHTSVFDRPGSTARAGILTLPNLSRALIKSGNIDEGLRIGHKAVEGALSVRSTRPGDRLVDMAGDVAKLGGDEAAELRRNIQQFATI